MDKNMFFFCTIPAMYHQKMTTQPRAPNSEWSGYGFSKTHLSLFPSHETGTGTTSTDTNNSSNNDSGVHEELNNNSVWNSSSGAGDSSSSSASSSTSGSLHEKLSQQGSETGSTMTGSGTGSMISGKTPLGPQTSNLLDFASSRASTDVSAPDLGSLFIQHGLEKYIGKAPLPKFTK